MFSMFSETTMGTSILEDRNSQNLEQLTVVDRPDLYDWLYQDYTEDIPMYVQLAASHDTILECGIGTGRIAIPLAQAGKTVYGIDNSTPMLRRLEQNLSSQPDALHQRIKFFCEDMRSFCLGQKFSLICVGFSSFNYLLTIEDQKASLRTLRKHLDTDGKLLLELLSFSLYKGWLNNEPKENLAKRHVDPVTREVVEMWRNTRFDATTQIVTENRTYKHFNKRHQLLEEETVLWKNRFFFLGEAELLLETEGFKITDIYGDFNLGHYHHGSESMIIVASAANQTE
jgi:hypothetical protein